MPDSKITALTSISTSTDPANDPLVIVDVSDTSMAATGTTKKVTLNQLLGASGTATLASATITGDLTVKTNVLKVDTTNNRVGIRTASPAEPLTVDNSSGVTTGAIRIYATDQSHSRLAIQNGNGQAYHLVAGNPGASNAGFALYDNTAAVTRWYVDNTGVHTFQNVGGVAGTAMTLNSTGLGVGISPSYKLNIGAANPTGGNIAQFYNNATSSLNGAYCLITQFGVQDWYMGQPAGVSAFTIGTGTTSKTEFFRIDGSGNVGIGVTPSAWSTSASRKTIQLSTSGSISAQDTGTAPYTFVASNWVSTATGDQYILGAAAPATLYRQFNGTHSWFNAPSGTGALSFTQAMTLDASGRLITNSSTFTPPTLNTNGDLNFIATSNTNVRFSYRGTDGVTRVANITLA